MRIRPDLLAALLATGLLLPALALAQEADGGIVAAAPDGGPTAVLRDRDECLDPLDDRGPLADALRALKLESGAQPAPITNVRIEGLTTLDEAALWALVGKPAQLERPLTLEEAALLVARLEETGLFERVAPALQVGPDGSSTLSVAVKEYPTVRKAVVRGLTEVSAADVLARLLEAPPERRERVTFAVGKGPDVVIGDVEIHGDNLRIRKRHRRRTCTWPAPPHAWVALATGETVHAGVAWRGLRPGVERALEFLRERGYLLARVDATLDAEGTLTVDVDEGRLEAVRLHGVHPRLESKVLELLDVRPGRPFLASELEAAFDRVHDALPFLHPGSGHPLLAPAVRVEQASEAGTLRYRTVPAEAPKVAPVGKDKDDDEDDDADSDDDDEEEAEINLRKPVRSGKNVHGAELSGRTLDVYFRAEPFTGSWAAEELIRHTQATGFAPGLAGSIGHWDEGGRYLLRIDGQFNVNTKRPSRQVEGDVLQKLNAQERVDWLVGPKVALPGLKLAEVGAQFHSLTDTTDRWRVTPLDAYLGSVWNNRPNAEYFRRSGVDAFLTTHLFERLTLGAEYRLDRYDSLTPLTHVWTIFNSNELAAPNPAIDDGEWGSLLFRAEFSTRKAGLEKVGQRNRDPERSLVERDGFDETELRTVNTLEVADPALGGDGAAYTKLISDSRFYLSTGGWSGLTLRFRAAGGSSLPAQKREALGGWDTLRGYGFKEFRGDRSVLGSAEYRFGILGAFVDLGAVRHADLGWDTPRLGTGLELALGDNFHFEAAWRTDSQATAAPELRLLFQRVF